MVARGASGAIRARGAEAGRRAAIVVCACVAAAACSNAAPSSERIEVVREAILNGATDNGPTSVVGIISELEDGGSSRVRCTGTLVAPNVVLTARHCVEDVDIVTCSQDFPGVQKWPALAIKTDVARHEVIRIHFPVTKKLCGDDIALFVLADAVPATEAPVAAVRTVTPPIEGETYSAVGYGRRCTQGGSDCASGIRMRRDALNVECVECRPKTFRGTTDSICSGDSGGPALDVAGVVFGVAAASGLGCTTSYYTRVDAHGPFLRKTVRDETAMAALTAPEWTKEPVSVDAGPSDAASDATAPPRPAAPQPPEAEAASAPTAITAPAAETGCIVAPCRTPSRGRVDVFAAIAVLAIARRIARRHPAGR